MNILASVFALFLISVLGLLAEIEIFNESANINSLELAALHDLYVSTNGSDWKWRNGTDAGAVWNFSDDPNPCFPLWQGLMCQCNLTQCAITDLELSSYNLNGTLPDNIGNLTYLSTVDLSNNSLKGTIPNSIGSWTTLSYFHCGSNQFTGRLPPSLYDLVELTYLNVESNEFQCEIPDSIEHLVNLQFLSYADNFFSGTLPSQIGDLKYMISFDLSSNNIYHSIPSSLCELRNLKDLYLAENEFEDQIPPCMGNMTRLENIFLNENDLDSTIPSTFGNLENLINLVMNNNYFLEGTLPAGLLSLQRLQMLDFADTRLDGSLPKFRLSSLETLNLYNDYFTGSIADSLTECSKLANLDLSENFLTGVVSLGNLTNLKVLDLSNNKFVGHINWIGELVNLEVTNFEYTDFTGKIPKSIGGLRNLTVFSLRYTKLRGTLPEELFSLTKLRYLNFEANYFSGTIPYSIGNLNKVVIFSLSMNRLTGSIPTSIGNLTSMMGFFLYGNQLTGTIPVEVCKSVELVNIGWYENSLNGTLPDCIGNLNRMRYLVLYSNQLTGTIPESYTQLPKTLHSFYVSDNQLTGTIPVELLYSNYSQYYFCLIDSNQFTGSLPEIYAPSFEQVNISSNLLSGSLTDSILNCSALTDFDTSYNLLSGTIPTNFGFFVSNFLFSYNMFTGPLPNASSYYIDGSYEVNNNLFTGKIPHGLCKREPQSIEIGSNLLYGTIPGCLVSDYLYYFDISNNLLSGAIPSTFNDAYDLETFTISNNLISGSLPMFLRTYNLEFLYVEGNLLSGPVVLPNLTSIEYIDISNNRYSGTLPNGYFNNDSSLLSFAATGNCITGSIPEELCTVSGLVFLDLDGLTTAESCRSRIFPNIKFLTSYVLPKQISGGIPICLFNMSAIETLHVSGNSMEWSFPGDFAISKTLTELSLSHNKITGTIPDVIQSRKWSSLDLSYNKLGGELNFVEQDANASLVLQVNRLSGEIPSSVLEMESINILTGNLFGCDLHRNSLPVHDTAYKIYQCGSNSFNQASIIWICFAAVIFGLGATAWFFRYYWWSQFVHWCKKTWDSTQSYMAVYDNNIGNQRLNSFKRFVLAVRNSTVFITIGIVVVFLPVYSVLTIYYRTVVHQYAWTVSAAFLSGFPPAMVLLLCYFGFILVLFVEWYRFTLKEQSESADESVIVEAEVRKKTYSQIVALTLVVIVNCSVMIAVNGAYVIIILNYSTRIIFAAQVLTALFKLLWNDFAVRGMIILARKVYNLTTVTNNNGHDAANIIRNDEDVDSDSDLYVSDEMPYMTFIVLFNSIIAPCLATAAVDSNCFVNVFIAPSPVTSEFPIISSDVSCSTHKNITECTGGVSESYIEVTYDPPFIYSYQCTSSILTNYASVYVFMFLMVAFVKPVMLYLLIKGHAMTSTGSLVHKLIDSTIYNLLRPANVSALKSKNLLFHKERFVLRTVGKIAVFVTFGVVFPPLAVVLCAAFNSESYLNLLIIGRFLVEIEDENIRKQFHERLSGECAKCIDLLLVPLVRLVVPFAALFYGFFVFDIYGDEVGFKRAVWTLVLLMVTPVFLWACYALNGLIRRTNQRKMTIMGSGMGTEMISINDVHQKENDERIV